MLAQCWHIFCNHKIPKIPPLPASRFWRGEALRYPRQSAVGGSLKSRLEDSTLQAVCFRVELLSMALNPRWSKYIISK